MLLLLRSPAPWMLLLVFLGLQVSLSSGARSKTRGADNPGDAPGARGQRSGHDKGAATGRGKFALKNNMQCTWAARDLGHAVRLSVKCEDPEARVRGGTSTLECKYDGQPQSCPGYRSDPKGFWKQVSRAFKRLQGKVCMDRRALVKASMCKRAPQDAHFKLDISSSVASASQGRDRDTTTTTTTTAPRVRTTTTTTAPRVRTTTTTTAPRVRTTSTTTAPRVRTTSTTGQNCTRHRKTAEEYCSSSWASVCSFLFTMVQNEEC